MFLPHFLCLESALLEVNFLEEIKSAFGKVGIGSGADEEKDTIFGILKQEHKLVQDNLHQILSSNQLNDSLFQQTVDALNAHMKGEEELLYPRLEDNPNTRRLAFMAYDEHNLAKQLISTMSTTSTDIDRWIARVTLLNNILNNHIDMEEREVFPKAKEVLYAQTESDIRSRYLSQRQPTAPTA